MASALHATAIFANDVINAYDVLFLSFHLCQDRMFFTIASGVAFLDSLAQFLLILVSEILQFSDFFNFSN